MRVVERVEGGDLKGIVRVSLILLLIVFFFCERETLWSSRKISIL